MGEFNAYGVYIPVFLIQAIVAFLVFKLVSILTNPWLDQGWVALPGVFNICLYIILLMGVHEGFLLFWGI
ncbi:DUF1656 domain-containing protein [Acinetobacter tibetensis]|uniref:DUF1656 domain-containing protein n=1 Tax=Acinetobacter tibetensis TaxID=2943497 RepID=UPI003A4D735D